MSAGTTAIKTGQVNFCDATAVYCTDIHLLGTAQLTSAGTASLTLRPAVGSYQYKAVFLGTTAYSTSVSGTSALSVTGRIFPSVTTIAQSGSDGDYTLTATVSSFAKSLPGPTGTVSFLDTTNNNALLATAELSNTVVAPALVNARNPQTGNEPGAVVAGDFNGDGNLDLAVGINDSSQSVSILLGDGTGNFIAVTNSPITASGAPQLVADFNGDGIPDLLLSSDLNASITALLGNGDGTFRVAPGSPFFTNYGESPIVVADFNGDGIPDLAVAGGYYLVIELGNGDGTFTKMPIASSSIYEAIYSSMVVGDLNGDGIPDIAALDLTGESISILLGNGDGTFRQGSSISTTTISAGSPLSLTLGDFNGDGKLDLAVPVYGSTGSVIILLGNGDGTFESTPASPISVEDWASGVAVGDFNGDGIADLLVSAQTSGQTLNILLGKGDGTFSQMPTGSVRLPCCSSTVLGDYNGDRITDIASSSFYDSTEQILLGARIQSTATATGAGPIDPPEIHLVEASYPGDTNFGSSVSFTTSLLAQAAAPVFSPGGGTYPSTQTVSISDPSTDITIYYTTDGSTPQQSSTVYSGPIMVSGSETINAIAVSTGAIPSPVGTAVYAIVPAPQLASLTPPFTSAGSAPFTLTLNGSGFVSNSTIYLGSTAVATQYVSATQLTGQIAASTIATAGITAVTVQNPVSTGGTSNALQFEVDTAGSETPPTFTSATSSVSAGATATYVVTLPSAATAVTATCLNLPTGASCSYSATTSTLTITTSSTTPSGTYPITVVFHETLPGAASALIVLPLLLLPLMGAGRTRTKIYLSRMLCLGILLTVGALAGCGGSGSSGSTSPTTHEVTSSSSVTLIVK